MRQWIDELSFGMRVVLIILIVAITIAVMAWDMIELALPALGLHPAEPIHRPSLRVTHLVVWPFPTKRLPDIDNPLRVSLLIPRWLPRRPTRLHRRRLGPERRNRIIVTKLTENDDYWPQKCRASF
jgi:hypothetical protein